MDPKGLRDAVGGRLLVALGISLLVLGVFWALLYRLSMFAVIPVLLAACVIVLAMGSRTS
jgi:hypothetical protein